MSIEERAATSAAELVGSLAILDAQYASVTVADDTQYHLCGDALLDIKHRAKAIEEKRKEIVTPLNEALRRVNALFKQPVEILDRIAARIDAGMTGYKRLRERQAAEERARLAAEAAAEQERIRKEAERQAKRAEKQGDAQTAALLRSTAEQVVVPAPVVQAEVPTIAGLASRETWEAEVFDFAALVTGVACGDVPLTVLAPVQTALNQAARMAKGQLDWPGVRAVRRTGMVRTGR